MLKIVEHFEILKMLLEPFDKFLNILISSNGQPNSQISQFCRASVVTSFYHARDCDQNHSPPHAQQNFLTILSRTKMF